LHSSSCKLLKIDTVPFQRIVQILLLVPACRQGVFELLADHGLVDILANPLDSRPLRSTFDTFLEGIVTLLDRTLDLFLNDGLLVLVLLLAQLER